jgi:hypothetical protein
MSEGRAGTRLASRISAFGMQDEQENLSCDPRCGNGDGYTYIKLAYEHCSTPGCRS